MAVSDPRSTEGMKATRERELKLGVGPRFRLPHLPGEPLAPRTLTNIYLDTPDHRLAVAGVTLRRRVEGRKSLWQLKLPKGKARLELELPGDVNEAARRRSRKGAPGRMPPPPRWSTSSPSGRTEPRWCLWPRCGRAARACWSATRADPSPRSCSTPCRC